MRGKQAKQLRQIARALTAGQPWSELQWLSVPGKRYVKEGEHMVLRTVSVPQARLNPDCGRALYQTFKQGYRRLQRKEAAAVQLLRKLRG